MPRELPPVRHPSRWARSRSTRRAGVLGAVAAVAVALLAGCAGDDDAQVRAEPIESIIEGDIEIAPDPSGTTATLRVDTTVPVACAVIYGPDDTFGSVAVDGDMQGGAHEDHSPLLSGLQPDTEYRYVLQGSDAAGTFYRSEVMTFRTPPADPSTTAANLAAGGTVTGASSSSSPAFAPELAIDGDLATEWSTDGDGDDAWIELDLGEPREIAAVAYRTRQMSDGTAIVETFTVTIDGGEPLGPFPAGTAPVELAEPVTGRTVRFDADRTTGGNTGAVELQLFAPS